MKNSLRLLGLVAFGFGMHTTAQAYTAQANVTFSWGGSDAGAATETTWTSSGGANTLSAITNDTYFSTLSGYNATAYYNSDFASKAGCNSLGLTDGSGNPDTASVRKYGCRFATNGFKSFPVLPPTDVGPVASATGTLIVTDTSITGTLTVNTTTDEPTGATTTFISGIRISNSVENGSSGYNIRTADGSPFGNAWYGVSAGATLTVNLTGTFNATTWEITGGSVEFVDSAFACQNGDSAPGSNGSLCTNYVTTGLFESDGSHLAWGMDPDGSSSALGVTEIEVRDPAGTATIQTLSGVLAALAVDSGGTITTTSGEIRRVQGSSGGGCLNHIRYNGTGVSCGALTATALSVTGTATELDPFTTDSFVDQTDVGLIETITSNTVAIVGLGTNVAISVSGDPSSLYAIDGGTWTSAAGTISDGQLVVVRHLSSTNFGTAVDTTLTVGGVTDTFTSTTLAQDVDPDAFTFTDASDVTVNTEQISNAITITGINDAAPISVTGDPTSEYRLGDGVIFTGWMNTPGTVANGVQVQVRHTSSASFNTAVNTTLTVGSVSDTFTSTTAAGDIVPDAFSFTDVTGVARSTEQVSNAVAIAGIDNPSPISVTGGEYSIDSGAWTSADGTVTNGQSVRVRHTSSASFSTAVDTTLTVGGVSDTFTSTTLAQDITPDAFSFTDVTNVALATLQTSNAVTIAGINDAAPISVTGGEYSIDGGAFTASAGTVTTGQQVRVRHTSSAAFSTAVNTTLTVGGVSDTFTSTTAAADTTPDAFSFADINNVLVNTQQVSNAITVAGINAPAPISVTGGEYSIDGGAFTAAAGSVSAGQQVQVRHNSALTANTNVDTTLTIGGVADTFTSRTQSAEPREDDGGSSLDLLALALLGGAALRRRRQR